MKKNIVLLFVFVLISAVTWFFYQKDRSQSMRSELTDFAVEDTASISKIFLSDKNNHTVLLERKPDNQWMVNGTYEAKKDVVKTLLETIHDVSVKSPVPKTMFQTTVKLMASNAVKVEIYQGKDKPSKIYYVGHPTQDHNGTFMLMEGSVHPFITHIEGFRGFLSTRYFTNEFDWRSTKIFQYDLGEIAKIRVENIQKPQESFEIHLGDRNAYKLFSYPTMNEVPFDTAKLLLYSALYKKVNFEYYEHYKSKQYQDSIRTTPALYTYAVTDVLGKTTSITSYLRPVDRTSTDYEGNAITHDVDRLYGYLNNKEMVMIQYYSFDPLSKGISYFKP